MISIVIVDDHYLVRSGLIALFEKTTDIKVIAQFVKGKDFLTALREGMTPDIAFLDISMPELDGLQVLQELHGFPKAPAVIMLSMHPEKAYAIKVVQAGAKAYLTKDSDDETLLKAVRVVALGGLFFSGTGTHLFQDHLSQVDIDKTESKSIDWAILSIQEKQVLKYSCQGMSIKEIAFEMEVAENTVSTYKSRLMKKLEVDNFVDLIRLAIATELE